jgi:hypothetical protein
MSDYEDKFDEIVSEYVPSSGQADTVIGEIARAIARIGYRFFNDGDMVSVGYGIGSCGSTYIYLTEEMRDELTYETYGPIASLEDITDEEQYEETLKKIVEQFVKDYESGAYDELKTQPNTVNSRSDFDKEAIDQFGEPEEDDYAGEDEDEYGDDEDF